VVNKYRAEFFARCPINDARIHYRLTIETDSVVSVEDLNDTLDSIRDGLHEDIADMLAEYGGKQTLVAEHHGVQIETTRETKPARDRRRGDQASQWLDQTVGGMAGTPGY
jgi:hypothetical protein